ncbi:JAB domain-containing protein [Pedobacter jamesrossensis]|uniref:JAB domain-containing protein n=1 Tax=Pedobacter jamesrossensis TaxID=1908238 RepID=A0ABV8NNF8_9SPHI
MFCLIPPGKLKSSESDNRLTRDAVASGLMLGLSMVDHLIFTDNGYYSYQDEGLI